MPAPMIGSFTWETWRGRLQRARLATRLYTRAGVDGAGVAIDAWRAEPTTIVTSARYVSLAQAITAIDRMRALSGSTQLIIDPLGQACFAQILAVTEEVDETIGLGTQVVYTWSVLQQAQEPR